MIAVMNTEYANDIRTWKSSTFPEIMQDVSSLIKLHPRNGIDLSSANIAFLSFSCEHMTELKLLIRGQGAGCVRFERLLGYYSLIFPET